MAHWIVQKSMKKMHLKDEADKVCVYYNYGIDRKIHSRNTDAHGK